MSETLSPEGYEQPSQKELFEAALVRYGQVDYSLTPDKDRQELADVAWIFGPEDFAAHAIVEHAQTGEVTYPSEDIKRMAAGIFLTNAIGFRSLATAQVDLKCF